tara:strand:- start:50 stop:655 length:606 start_codon:yes stop_codon:yes gene_type:complete
MAEVVCKHCGAVGEVTVISIHKRTVQYRDLIDHEDDCVIRKKLEKKIQPKHLRKKKWRKQERRAADLVGARETPASGALNEDGDAREFHGVRLECKQTRSSTYLLNSMTWRKAVEGALRADEIPILQVELHDPRGVTRFCVVPQGVYEIESQEVRQRYMRTGLKLKADMTALTPFHVTTLDPHPVVVTESQLMEAMRDNAD